jgi:putative membrane protein
MTRVLTLFAALLFSFGLPGIRAGDDKPGDKPFDDTEFVQKAASGGMHEVALGKIATIKAKNANVKAFAELMVADHGKANEDLKKAAAAANIPVPDTMNEKHQKEVDRFKNYNGTEFDRDYMKHMIADHEHDAALFTRASKEAKNPAIKEFATRTLAVVQDHLKAAKKIQPTE